MQYFAMHSLYFLQTTKGFICIYFGKHFCFHRAVICRINSTKSFVQKNCSLRLASLSDSSSCSSSFRRLLLLELPTQNIYMYTPLIVARVGCCCQSSQPRIYIMYINLLGETHKNIKCFFSGRRTNKVQIPPPPHLNT